MRPLPRPIRFGLLTDGAVVVVGGDNDADHDGGRCENGDDHADSARHILLVAALAAARGAAAESESADASAA